MDQPTVEALRQRMDRIERENRRLKVGGGLLLAGLGMLTLLGASTATNKTVEAESFIVKDSTGKVRAVLGTTDPYNAPGLVMYDQEGHSNILLHLTGDGEPGFWLYEQDKVRATLNAVGDRVHLQLYDPDNRMRASFLVSKDGAPSLELFDQDENLRSSLR